MIEQLVIILNSSFSKQTDRNIRQEQLKEHDGEMEKGAELTINLGKASHIKRSTFF